MTGLLQDVRFAARQLRKSPVFTAVSVMILALGIGANTAIYTLLDQILFRNLPVKDPNSLVLLRSTGKYQGMSRTRSTDHLYFSYPAYRNLRDHNSSFSGLIATCFDSVGVQWNNEPGLADTELVSGNYFDVLGVQPALGRLFVASDDVAPEANPVVVLSFNYWKQRFALDPKILNQSILINGHPFNVIGVAEPEFHSVVPGDHPAIFVPMMMKAQITPTWNDLEERRSQWLNIVGRLKPGINREQAQASIDPVWHSIRADEFRQMGHGSPRFQDAFVNQSHLFLDEASKGIPIHGVPTPLQVVIGLSGLLALMACVNIAGLLLVRISARSREISVRSALGAQRGRLIQQLLIEGLLLGFAGAAVAIVLAPQITTFLMHKIWADSANSISYSARPDLRIFAFNFALSLCVSLLFSLAPALQCWRPDVIAALKQQAATITGGSIYLRRASVVAQIAISLLLLVASGLFVRTLHNLKLVDVGFTPDHLVTFRVNPGLAGYQSSQTMALYQQILDKLSGLPGVRSAAATNDPELADNNWGNNITIAGYRPAENEDMNVEWARVSGGYFSTLNMTLLAGRELTSDDHAGTAKVAVVNETFARRYFGRPQDALGHYFCSGAGDVKPDIEIVGVVKDAKHTTVRDKVRRSVFTPYSQLPDLSTVSFGLTFYARTWQAPEDAEATIRKAMQSLDSKLVLDDFFTMPEQIDKNFSREKLIALFATCFGILAALMAAIGIYAVLAFSTAQRTREIGVRMAMGAGRTNIASLVFGEVLRLAGIGMAIGIPLSLLLTRALRSQLYGISTYDALTLCAVCGALVVVAFVSAALPARRATKVDPMVALRYE